jgi:hypothetical protein
MPVIIPKVFTLAFVLAVPQFPSLIEQVRVSAHPWHVVRLAPLITGRGFIVTCLVVAHPAFDV